MSTLRDGENDPPAARGAGRICNRGLSLRAEPSWVGDTVWSLHRPPSNNTETFIRANGLPDRGPFVRPGPYVQSAANEGCVADTREDEMLAGERLVPLGAVLPALAAAHALIADERKRTRPEREEGGLTKVLRQRREADKDRQSQDATERLTELVRELPDLIALVGEGLERVAATAEAPSTRRVARRGAAVFRRFSPRRQMRRRGRSVAAEVRRGTPAVRPREPRRHRRRACRAGPRSADDPPGEPPGSHSRTAGSTRRRGDR
jgi:hypothetical protein